MKEDIIESTVDCVLLELGMISLEEYLWSIHKHIDFTIEAARLQNTMHNAMGIPHKYIVNNQSGPATITGIKAYTYIKPGYVYAPYVPMIKIPPADMTWKDKYKRKTIIAPMTDKMREIFNNMGHITI